jgi:transaldolase
MRSDLALSALRVKIFADGADKAAILDLYSKPWIGGFTTNPTLMRKAGVSNYEAFARDILAAIPDRPVSLEVFADEFSEMERQARLIASWAGNVYVKIPVTNTRRESSSDLVHRLSHSGIKLNVTALLTLSQIRETACALAGGAPSSVSVFAGRIADTGSDPIPVMAKAVEILRATSGIELIWASTRELLNIVQADQIGCDIITVPDDILKKIGTLGRDLDDLSLDTVKMFYADACQSGFQV